MARNRVIYQSEALYVSDEANSTAVGNHTQLHRVQSANYSFNISRQDVNQYGQVGRIDSLILEAPTVSFDMSYLLHDGSNEVALGFADSSDFSTNAVGFASGHMTAGSGKNFYILQSEDGVDTNTSAGASLASSVIGIGNAYLTDYTLDASVGSIPTVSCSYEGLNINSTTDIGVNGNNITGVDVAGIQISDGSKINSNAILPDPTTGSVTSTALRPGDIEISFGAISSNDALGPIVDISDGNDGSHVQSVSLNFSMSRTPIERLGNLFPYARPADFPTSATFNVSAIVNEVTAANLVDIVASGQIGTDIDLTFKNSNASSTPVCKYRLKNAKLVSESISSSIGSNKTVDLTFDVSIGGPSDNENNIFMSGAAS